MYISPHEWSQPRGLPPAAPRPAPPHASLQPAARSAALSGLYRQLADGTPDAPTREQAARLLRHQLTQAEQLPCSLPDTPEDLPAWMAAGAQSVTARYSLYLEERQAGAPRRYFSNRSHALYFLRNVAPTKLVDGAWLYGLLEHWGNPRFADLIRTYLEELGDGAPDKNHVVLYRKLLARYGLEPIDDLDDAAYLQGAIQLALGWNAREFLPEVIGFNLGYEQLPLHLLITAYELNELNIDPYYFTLHITVDNADSGHAQRACQAVVDTLPRLGGAGEFWQRVRNGSKLADAGRGTGEVIAGFDIDAEVVRVLARKSASGRGAHSDYCKVAGRKVNEWLSQPEQIPAFLQALEDAGWIRRGRPAAESRFWALLQGERAEMFGVFSPYELQLIHDWLRGPQASADGQPYAAEGSLPAPRQPSFRAATRLAQARGGGPLVAEQDDDLLDPDLAALQAALPALDDAGQARLLVQALAPSQHWTPAGLLATRLFDARLRA